MAIEENDGVVSNIVASPSAWSDICILKTQRRLGDAQCVRRARVIEPSSAMHRKHFNRCVSITEAYQS